MVLNKFIFNFYKSNFKYSTTLIISNYALQIYKKTNAF